MTDATMSAAQDYWSIVLRQLRKNRLGLAGLCVVGILYLPSEEDGPPPYNLRLIGIRREGPCGPPPTSQHLNAELRPEISLNTDILPGMTPFPS